MVEPTPIPLTASRVEQIFPILSTAQTHRLVAHGHVRSVRAGDVLVKPGDREIPIFVVISGELEAVRPLFGHLYLLVRGSGLADSMSRYLIRRIEQTPNINLLCNTELLGLDGGNHLERVKWRNNQTGDEETKSIAHVFVMTGAEPNTGWLNRCVALDDKGFIKTGPELFQEELIEAHWPLTRRPYLLETSLPGVFAAGDVRAGNVKRAASAVGEGSIVISFVHQVLKE